MRVLVLSRYGMLGASSRLRIRQYLPHFREAGIEMLCHALLDDEYLNALYARRAAPRSVLRGYSGRLRALWQANRFDALLVEKESLPWLPALIELALYGNTPLWVDYDDAIFHRYDRHTSALVRAGLGRKLDAIMHRADLVTAGNNYLMQHAVDAECRHVEYVPTVIDLRRYPRAPKPPHNHDVVIGWIGSPSTANYLKLVAPTLERLARRHPIRCVAIGARADQLRDTPFHAAPWSEATEVEQVRGIDIGIMPLPDTPWERGKCGYKLIQYMACGLPVVASPVGVNNQIVRGDNGYLADDAQAWSEALERLILDAPLRAAMGRAGRARVEQEFCLQVQAPRLIGFLQELVGERCAA
jgi:glycosyltransferase involved in cell wall biosynthesis